MSINDPVIIEYNEKHGFYYLTRGRETFYDYENYLITFDTQQEAIEFSLTNLDTLPEIKEGLPCSKPKQPNQAQQLRLDLAP